METLPSDISNLLADIEARRNESKKKMKKQKVKEASASISTPVEGTGGLYYQGQEIPGGENALSNTKFKKEAVVGVPGELAGLTRSHSRETQDPAKSSRLDELVRHPVSGKLVHPNELPKNS